jgi:hypothetical protein
MGRRGLDLLVSHRGTQRALVGNLTILMGSLRLHLPHFVRNVNTLLVLSHKRNRHEM